MTKFNLQALLDNNVAAFSAAAEEAQQSPSIIEEKIPDHWRGMILECADLEAQYRDALDQMYQDPRFKYAKKDSNEGMARDATKQQLFKIKSDAQNKIVAQIPSDKRYIQIDSEDSTKGRGFWDVYKEVSHLAGNPHRLVALLDGE